jgi:hypothetical protein
MEILGVIVWETRRVNAIVKLSNIPFLGAIPDQRGIETNSRVVLNKVVPGVIKQKRLGINAPFGIRPINRQETFVTLPNLLHHSIRNGLHRTIG